MKRPLAADSGLLDPISHERLGNKIAAAGPTFLNDELATP